MIYVEITFTCVSLHVSFYMCIHECTYNCCVCMCVNMLVHMCACVRICERVCLLIFPHEVVVYYPVQFSEWSETNNCIGSGRLGMSSNVKTAHFMTF